MSNNDSDSDPSFTIPLPLPPPPPPPPSNAIVIYPNPDLQFALSPRYSQSPKRKRSKTIASSSSSNPSPKPKPKPAKKPDPDAPKITRPCTECGKRFWSLKALFGHMRCHPERQWRGINPPPNHLRVPKRQRTSQNWQSVLSEEDHEVASYLVMMANSTPVPSSSNAPSSNTPSSSNNERFECGVCKKVFGSHQALGGHRASHKNVKGCFAITNVSDDLTVATTTSCSDHQDHHQGKIVAFSGNHKCNVCFRVFSSGQALGGHMRCHFEKEETTIVVGALDLNVPAIQQDPSTTDTVECSLDLRLGL